MARKRRRKDSVRSYFRGVFDANPKWLELSSNSNVVEQWKKDHPGKEFTPQIRQSMGSCKSAMRTERGIPSGPRRGGRKKAAKVQPKAAVSEITQLEGRIYDCISAAREMDVAELVPVVKHLRKALAYIVLAFDEPV